MVCDRPASRSPIVLPIQNQPPAQFSQQMPPIAIATPAIEYKAQELPCNLSAIEFRGE